MTPRQTEILRILQTHSTPLKREDICALLPANMRCARREIQKEIQAIEESGVPVLAGKGEHGGYELASISRGNMEAYRLSILTEERLIESHGERVKNKWKLYHARCKPTVRFEPNGQGAFV